MLPLKQAQECLEHLYIPFCQCQCVLSVNFKREKHLQWLDSHPQNPHHWEMISLQQEQVYTDEVLVANHSNII